MTRTEKPSADSDSWISLTLPKIQLRRVADSSPVPSARGAEREREINKTGGDLQPPSTSAVDSYWLFWLAGSLPEK